MLVAGSTSTRGLRSRGWLNGCIVGFIYMLLIYLAGSIVYKDFSFDNYMITMFIIGIITGAIGGIIGINMKQGRHRR
jgi:putative membrane protein (TIGR04086 family)